MILITNVEDPTLGEPFAIAVIPGGDESTEAANAILSTIVHMSAGSRAYYVDGDDPDTIMLALDWAAEDFADDLRSRPRCTKCEFPILTKVPFGTTVCDYCKETS